MQWRYQYNLDSPWSEFITQVECRNICRFLCDQWRYTKVKVKCTIRTVGGVLSSVT